MSVTLTIKKPDDFHCHFRDEHFLSRTVVDTAKQFSRAIAMPNLKEPVVTVVDALAYRDRIMVHVPADVDFTPLMTLYLSQNMTPDDVAYAKQSGVITAYKLYPAGATTNSQSGIDDLNAIYPLLEQLQTENLPLCIHGESIKPDADIFDRERLFLENLQAILNNFPKLRIILEHISTKAAVDFVMNASENLAATITPQHLHYNRNDLLLGGVRPHYYCLPILKRAADQKALVVAATSGNPKFFLGTDSAPHVKSQKQSVCGCAGIYSANAALALYTEIFEAADALDKLENFASVFGAQFYQLPLNTETIMLTKKSWEVPLALPFGSETVVPMKAGETLSWQIQT